MYTLRELADIIGAELLGEADCRIDAIASLNHAKPGTISFLSNRQFRDQLGITKASAVIISQADRADLRTNGLITDEPYVAYAKVATLLHPFVNQQSGVHASAVVDDDAQVDPTAWIGPCAVVGKGARIGANCHVGPGCFVGEEVSIGADSLLVANVTIFHKTQIGERAIIHPGAVAGSDGFGLANDHGKWIKIPQIGRLVIGNDVEIGANTTIDRGAIEDTVLEDGVKIDNLVQIAHNVRIGAHTVMAAQVGIAGSTKIGKYCAFGGQVGIAGHIEVTDHVTITGRGMVVNSITEPGTYSSGIPLDTNIRWRKNVARFRQLDDLAKTVNRLQKQIERPTPEK
ncbi:MAG: UDP-3-O-(3-hydroxymyristoyl) glucosamine N-acyltransferase [Gammaproteobacteria bacterium SG8_11]|nr:MAG: UDP-3-O-(3-hydroxymyristoyl) glucosamine N-acyltransferase [Gammaproteobacteria bacterium SG8_11]